MNLSGHKNRSIGSAWMISFGNTGGILAPFAFLATDAPYYHTGYSICVGVTALGVAATLCYTIFVLLERRRASTDDRSDVPSL
jgi:hypothetical protein